MNRSNTNQIDNKSTEEGGPRGKNSSSMSVSPTKTKDQTGEKKNKNKSISSQNSPQKRFNTKEGKVYEKVLS